MEAVPLGYRLRLRELTLGWLADGLQPMTHHDGGSTWAAMIFDSHALDPRDPRDICSWAGATLQYDGEMMIGVYTDGGCTGRGYGSLAVKALLHHLLAEHALAPGDHVNASTWRWPRYAEIVSSCGLECRPWGVEQ